MWPLVYTIIFCSSSPSSPYPNEKLSKQGLLSKAETPNLLALKSCWEAAAERGGGNSDAVRDVDQAGIRLLFHLDGTKMLGRGSLNQYKPIKVKRTEGERPEDKGF